MIHFYLCIQCMYTVHLIKCNWIMIKKIILQWICTCNRGTVKDSLVKTGRSLQHQKCWRLERSHMYYTQVSRCKSLCCAWSQIFSSPCWWLQAHGKESLEKSRPMLLERLSLFDSANIIYENNIYINFTENGYLCTLSIHIWITMVSNILWL